MNDHLWSYFRKRCPGDSIKLQPAKISWRWGWKLTSCLSTSVLSFTTQYSWCFRIIAGIFPSNLFSGTTDLRNNMAAFVSLGTSKSILNKRRRRTKNNEVKKKESIITCLYVKLYTWYSNWKFWAEFEEDLRNLVVAWIFPTLSSLWAASIFKIWTEFWNWHISFEHCRWGFRVPVEINLVYWWYI